MSIWSVQVTNRKNWKIIKEKQICDDIIKNLYEIINEDITPYEKLKRKQEVAEIERSHPLLATLRLQNDSCVLWFMFKNIKKANDFLGQRTVDFFVDTVKQVLYKNFFQKYPTERLVKSDYKGLIFNIRKDSWEKALEKILG